jgi:LPXTG-motif cell wall-anchored protein
MRLTRTLAITLTALFFFSTLCLTARADERDKTTRFSFPDAVQIPGAVLPAGTYVFKLANSDSNRHIVQVYDQDQMRLLATVLAIPDYQTDPADRTVIRFAERPASQPEAIAAWFYPGDNYGQEFVYPKSGQRQLALVSDTNGPSSASEQPGNSSAEQIAQENSSPAPDATPQTQPNNSTTGSTGQTEANTTPLPKTASPLPLIGLVGLLLTSAAIVLRRKTHA